MTQKNQNNDVAYRSVQFVEALLRLWPTSSVAKENSVPNLRIWFNHPAIALGSDGKHVHVRLWTDVNRGHGARYQGWKKLEERELLQLYTVLKIFGGAPGHPNDLRRWDETRLRLTYGRAMRAALEERDWAYARANG